MWHTSSAILLWMSHQTWPSTVWQTYDYDFDINGAYEGARKGCEPLHVQATLPNWSVELVNSTSQPLNNASVTATVYNLDGVQAGPSQIVKASAPASSKFAWDGDFRQFLLALQQAGRYAASQ